MGVGAACNSVTASLTRALFKQTGGAFHETSAISCCRCDVICPIGNRTGHQPGRFSPSERSEASGYKQILDNERARGWRLVLGPGASVPAITQKAPGVRIVLSGGDIVESETGHAGEDMNLKLGDFI
jgi:hypothetical protein